MKRALIILIILCSVLSTSFAYAVCGGSGLNRVAASASRTDVNDCVTAASTGAIITVPAGTATWSSDISIPSNKDIAIIGAGIGNTNITCSNGVCFTIAQAGQSCACRISGFTFNNGYIYMTGLQGNKPVRIDNNRFTISGTYQVMDIGSYNDGIHPTVLIDNNQFVNTMVHAIGSFNMLDAGSQQHAIWAQNTQLGDYDDVIYIESNTFTGTVHQNAVDANYGGRFVFRFNSLSQTTYIEAHSVQGYNRSAQRWEIYNNSFTNMSAGYQGWIYLRGGTGVVFDNTIDISNPDAGIQLNNVRSCRDPGGTNGKCSGASNWDQNSVGQQGWACRDQIGRGYDTTQWSVGAAFSQPLKPAYIWNNTKLGGAQFTLGVLAGESCTPTDLNSTHIQANRDYYTHNTSFNGTTGVGRGTIASRPATCTTGVGYWATDEGEWNSNNPGADGQLYKCTATNTWTLYYIPYTYPHPLATGGGGGPDPAIIKLLIRRHNEQNNLNSGSADTLMQ